MKINQRIIKERQVILEVHKPMFRPSREKEFYHHADRDMKPNSKAILLKRISKINFTKSIFPRWTLILLPSLKALRTPK